MTAVRSIPKDAEFPTLTEEQVLREMCALERDDVDGAADLYRRALAAGSAFEGLARSLRHLQHDPTALRLRIEKLIEDDFAADPAEAAKSDSPAP